MGRENIGGEPDGELQAPNSLPYPGRLSVVVARRSLARREKAAASALCGSLVGRLGSSLLRCLCPGTPLLLRLIRGRAHACGRESQATPKKLARLKWKWRAHTARGHTTHTVRGHTSARFALFACASDSASNLVSLSAAVGSFSLAAAALAAARFSLATCLEGRFA